MSTRTSAYSISRGAIARQFGPLAWLRTFSTVWRERRMLERLDDHILKDIGRSRDEADAEAKRPAWDAPSRWLR